MPLAGGWCKVWIYFGFVFAWTKGARPRFDTSTDMGLVLIPADAEIDSVIFRLRATDQDADFPLVFEITATITPVVRIDNLPCTLYNKVCQANVILTKRLIPGRLHDFAVRVRDTKGDSNSMQATISVTNATTPRDKIFPHIPSLIMVPEDTKPGKELDYLLVRANSWSGKPVYIELWQPKELFTIRQRQTPTQTRGIITLIGELDFETQSMYTLTMYATDPYTEPGKDTRNIAGLNVVVVVQDVQDVPPIFTLAPPLTRINNSVQPGDVVLRVHAEDGDKGVPREIAYGLVSEGNPFTPFFNISETTGEIVLARPLEELTQITHVGAPVVLSVVAEEIRRSREEPPTQATVVDVGFLLGEPGNSPPYFESDNYVVTIDENPEPGIVITFGEQYTTKVRDEDIGKAGVFALKLENNNGTFEINPTVAERTADFIITVRDNTLIDYETHKSLSFKIIAQEVGPATNLSASAPVTVYLRDINDNPPIFDEESYEVTLSENVTAGTRVVQVHATDKDTGILGSIKYTNITGSGSEAFNVDPDTGLITVAMASSLDREIAARLVLSVEARDENGKGNKGVVSLIVNLLDVNDNAPVFEKELYQFTLNSDLTNFTTPAVIKAIDADAEPPNNEVRYEVIHGNYENKFYLNDITGELILRSPITKIRRKKQSAYENFEKKNGKEFVKNQDGAREFNLKSLSNSSLIFLPDDYQNRTILLSDIKKTVRKRRKRADDDALYTLTARAYDLGVPHLSSVTQIRIFSGAAMEARIVMFVVPGEHPDSTRTAETLAAITGGRVTVLETRPYMPQNVTGTGTTIPRGNKKSIVVARVEQTEAGAPLVDVEKIRETLAANGVGIIGGSGTVTDTMITNQTKSPGAGGTHVNDAQTTIINQTVTTFYDKEVTVYKAENKLLFWLLIILGLLMLLAIAALIICCICPGCPFYMAPRKRRVHSSETLVVRTDGRPKRHLHRNPPTVVDVIWNGRKQAWSADPMRRNWQFNKRNTKNFGLSSLPGDVAYISGQQNDIQVNIEPLRVREGPYDPSRRNRMEEQERMYMEDIDARKVGGYDENELDSLQRHELERGSDVQRQSYRQRSETRYVEPEANEEGSVREQHFYREGNAEVLRLVTRGQVDDANVSHHHHHHHHPTTLVVDGKDIILKRFIEDQKSRNELSVQDIEAARSMESHQRTKEVYQQQPEIIIIPERLDLGHRHVDELGPNVQRLLIEHSDYGSQKMDMKESQIREMVQRQEKQERQEKVSAPSMTDKPSMTTNEQFQTTNLQSYSFHDLELARQNALLTRLLLERENRHASGVAVDSSYLETQSLPGQVAIATQTDKTASTQTERQVRSRSDNDESDDDSRYRKKSKSKKRYGDGDWKKARTLWMKSPIEEEDGPCFDKRLSILRKKVREVKEGRKISLEPDVLKEISDSLDDNASSYQVDDEDSMQTYERSTKQTSVKYKILNQEESGSPSSLERRKDKGERVFNEKIHETTKDSRKMDTTESTSSPEIKSHHEKCTRSKMEEKSPKKEMKTRIQKKVEDVVKPSFKILEREITVLTKKLSKLGDKKQESTGSDSTSQEKSEESTSKDSNKQMEQKTSKKIDVSSSKAQKSITSSSSKASLMEQNTLQRKEAAITKSRHKLKYQQAQVISPGSSEYEEVPEKPRKQSTGHIQDSTKQKQPISTQSHARTKRQAHADRREHKKPVSQVQDHELDKRKDTSSKDTAKSEMKPEKSAKMTSRAPKLGSVSRKGNGEENSTSTSSEVADGKKSSSSQRNSDKKSKTSSENDSSETSRIKSPPILEKISGKISGYFEKSKKQDDGRRATMKSEIKEVKDNKDAIKDDVPPDKVSAKENLMKVIEMPAKEYFQETTKKIIEDVTSDIAVVKRDISDEHEAIIIQKEKDAFNEDKKEDKDIMMETEPERHEEEDKISKELRSAAEAIIVCELKPNEVKYQKFSETASEVEENIDDKLESMEEDKLGEDIKSSDEKVQKYSEEEELSLKAEKYLKGTGDKVLQEKEEEMKENPEDKVVEELKHETSAESYIIPKSNQPLTDKEVKAEQTELKDDQLNLENEMSDLHKQQTQTLSTDDETDLRRSDEKVQSIDYELLSEEMTSEESKESKKMDEIPTVISKDEVEELAVSKSPEISDKNGGDKTQREIVDEESFQKTKDDKNKEDMEDQIDNNILKTSPLHADDTIYEQKTLDATSDKMYVQKDLKDDIMISPRPESPIFYVTEEKLKNDKEEESNEESASDTKIDDQTHEMAKQKSEENLTAVKQSELKTEEKSKEFSKPITPDFIEDKKEVDLTSDIFVNETVEMAKKEVEDQDLYEFLNEERKLEAQELNGKPIENLNDKDLLEDTEVSTKDKFEKKFSDDVLNDGRTTETSITESEQKELEVSEELQDKTLVSDKLQEAQSSKFIDNEISGMVKESDFEEKEKESKGEDNKATTFVKPQIERQFSDNFLDEKIMSSAEKEKSEKVEDDKSGISDKEEIKFSDDFLGDKITPLIEGSELQDIDKKVSIEDDKILNSDEVEEKTKFSDDDFLEDKTLAPKMGKETKSTRKEAISEQVDERITPLMIQHEEQIPGESLNDKLTLSTKDRETEKSEDVENPNDKAEEIGEVTEHKQISADIYDGRTKSPTKEELFKTEVKIEELVSDKKSPENHFPGDFHEERITPSETKEVIKESVPDDEKGKDRKMSHENSDNNRISKVENASEETGTIVDKTKKVEEDAIVKSEESTETKAEETKVSEEYPLNKVKAFKVIETKIPESKRDSTEASDNYQKTESFLIPTLIPEMTVKEGPESDGALSPIRPGSRGQLGSGCKESKFQSIEASGEERALEQDKSEPLTSKLLSKVDNLAETLGGVSSEKNVSQEKNIKTHSEEKFFEEGDDIAEEQYVDVSLPLFTSIIDTLDDSDESDSSSDISRKTTLTMRPHHTPRHQARSVSEKEDTGMEEKAERRNIDDDEPAILMVELIDDKYEPNSKPHEKLGMEDDKEEEAEHTDSNKEMGNDDSNGATDKSDATLDEQSSSSHDKESSDKDSKDAEQSEGLKSKSVTESAEKPSTNGANVKYKKRELGQDDVRTATASTSETQKMVSDALKVPSGKQKQVDRKKSLPRKKSNSDKKSEERNTQPDETNAPSGEPHVRKQVKAHHPRHRNHKDSEADKMKQKESDQLKPKDSVVQRKSKEAEEKLFQKPVQHFSRRQSIPKSKAEKKSSSSEKSSSPPKTGEVDTSKTQPKYMSWYKKKREEMEQKREELKALDDDEQLPRWLRKSIRNKKTEQDAKKKQEHKTPEMTPRTRRKVKPLVNVESEQLKAIVRQGRKLRKAEGGRNEDPPIQIFASTPPTPPVPGTKHHLMQHSEYKYEKIPPPFYLHPPPAPHPSPQLSPERFGTQTTMECRHSEDDLDPNIAISLQGGSRLRNQQLLDKKSVFDIAYNEAAPSQLRSDSTTPPS